MAIESILDAEIIAPLITAAITVVTAYGFNLKNKLSQIKKLVVEIEEANADNNITAEEFTGLVKSAKKICE